jgi:hypothetical protein
MSAYSDSIFKPAFFEPAPVSAKNIETKVKIRFFRPFPSVFIPNGEDVSAATFQVEEYHYMDAIAAKKT